MNSLTSSRKQFLAVALTAAVLASAFAMMETVSAQNGPNATCSGEATTFGTDYFGSSDFGNRLLAGVIGTRTFSLGSGLVAGEYVVDAVSYDGYPDRVLSAPQTQEQWFAEFLSASGTVLATTLVTGDIADGVNENTWAGPIGTVILSDTATDVRIVHAASAGGGVESVRPVCIGATFVEPVVETTTTTEVPATTEAPETTSTAAPETTTTAPGTSTTVAPTTTAAPATTTTTVAPTTTTVAVEVAGTVEVPAAPAVPQSGTPSFTG